MSNGENVDLYYKGWVEVLLNLVAILFLLGGFIAFFAARKYPESYTHNVTAGACLAAGIFFFAVLIALSAALSYLRLLVRRAYPRESDRDGRADYRA